MKIGSTRLTKFWIPFIAVIVVIFAGLFFLRRHIVDANCSADSREIRFPASDIRAVVTETACSGFGATDVVRVFIQSGAPGFFNRGKVFFVYDPSPFSAPLRLTWLSAKSLNVVVDRVAAIDKQRSNVEGVSIHYQIGHVGEPQGKVQR
jgi:hypothetical protein